MTHIDPTKVNRLILCPNTKAKRAWIEEYLNSTKHGVTHITSKLETNCNFSIGTLRDCHLTLPKRCWVLQANTWSLYNAKVGIDKHGAPASTYKGLKKTPPIMWSMSFDFVLTTLSVM